MLGKFVRVRVTRPFNFTDKNTGLKYRLNFGTTEVKLSEDRSLKADAVVMGIHHPVRVFDGKVIARVRHSDPRVDYLVVASKKSRFINFQIEDAVRFLEKDREYRIECLYESSCGAVIYCDADRTRKFLLIKNMRSSNWGFPKGHIERGESKIETAKREVLEETGLQIRIIDGFSSNSEYKISGRIEKRVTIFLGESADLQVTLQPEEIVDSIWVDYNTAYRKLKFDNDKHILASANRFLAESIKEGN